MEVRFSTFSQKANCCGCNGCVQICPQKCITMLPDLEGFWYPQIDQSKCIHCNKCEEVCPVLNNRNERNNYLISYAAYNKNEKERMNSSSGGIFVLLASAILSKKGVVFGAAFDQDWSVSHIKIEEIERISLLQGSKYLQSKINSSYQEAKDILEEGRPVLFSGTGCQISGLKRFLKKEYDQLFTVDILCHGVPSPFIWKRYLSEIEKKYNSRVKHVSFRDKSNGWNSYQVSIELDTTRQIRKFNEDQYMKLFLSDINLRPSCYKCKFKTLSRDSDLTIGDAWGVKRIFPEMDDDKGTSIILVHSQKGKKLIGDIKNSLVLKEERINILLPPKAGARKSAAVPLRRKTFFKDINNISIEESMRFTKRPLVKRIIQYLKRKIKKFLISE